MNSDMLFRHHYSGVVKDTVKIRYLMFEIVANDIKETGLMRSIFGIFNSQLPDIQGVQYKLRSNFERLEKLEVTSRILEEL
jgi:hypothetical protein